jgi:nucleolar protein 56
MARTVVTTWFGTFLMEGDRVVRSSLAPASEAELEERARVRRGGGLTPEEAEILSARGDEEWTTADRRLAERGLRLVARTAELPGSIAPPPARDVRRRAVLAAGARALADAWDPSIHVEEAVRAATDLDRVRNLVGERLGSWVARDSPDIDPGNHGAAAARALEEDGPSEFGPTEPGVREARRRLADLYRAIDQTHREISDAITAAVPLKTPNLNALLGPDLAARLLAQARGLDRLARLPSSTIQVLGAERAFFEHLRGKAPPPRHGLFFLHPAIQSATRYERGKLSRTLAGKVAIAARLDRAGKPIDPTLLRAFEARRSKLKEARAPGRSRARRSRSGKPLDAAARDG